MSHSLAGDVMRLCLHPNRAVGEKGHEEARGYLLRRFAELGLVPYVGESYELPYGERHGRFVNVVGVAPGVAAAQGAPVLIGAHYDTCATTPGADDNAAAVAIALEVARRLLAAPASRPVVVAHFDAEEPPYFLGSEMGSVRFVQDQMETPVHAALIMDLVGHAIPISGLEDVLGIMGCESHPQLAAIAAELNGAFQHLVTIPNRFMPDMSDHHAFRTEGIPYLFLTAGQGPDYHLPTDTPERLDYGRMARTADTLEALVRRVADAPMAGAAEHDTRELDFRHLCSALGSDLADRLGLRTPADLDRGVRSILSSLLGR